MRSADLPTLAICALLVALGWIATTGCRAEPEPRPGGAEAPDETDSTEGAAPEATPACRTEQRAWELRDGQWRARCYDAPLPRDAAQWFSDGLRTLALTPSSCGSPHDVKRIHLLEDAHVERVQTGVAANATGRAAGLGLLDDTVYLVGGEYCPGGDAAGRIARIRLNGRGASYARMNVNHFWSHLVQVDGELLQISSALAARSTLAMDGVINFGASEGCDNITAPPDPKLGRLCRIFVREWDITPFNQVAMAYDSIHSRPAFPFGLANSYVYDEQGTRLVQIGGLYPNQIAWDPDDPEAEPLRYEHTTHATARPRYGTAYRLPDPPVVGDGVTLLYDSVEQRVMLLDPFGDHSFYLADDDTHWVALDQAPLPDTPPELRAETTVPEPPPLDARPFLRSDLTLDTEPSLRFTQHAWPYFAFFDREAGVPVVIPYDDALSLCLPLEQHPDLTACNKAHP